MKSKIYLSVLFLIIVLSVHGQFVTKPLNYQVPGDIYIPSYISIVDADHVWLGTKHYLSTGTYLGYTYAVHTNDGGDTWIFDSIPVLGVPWMSSVYAVDENTAFYVFSDNNVNGSIWKTTDNGATWTQKTGTEFQGGGFADFYKAFNDSEGVAVGDPKGGYFEIYRTTNGGDTWTRIDSSSIPANLTGEMGFTNAFASVGDTIWFTSMLGRCFKSTDQGQHWTATTVVSTTSNCAFEVAFSNAQKGVFYYNEPAGKNFFLTSDGGATWAGDTLSENCFISHMSSVEGFDGGFVIATFDTVTSLANVYFTPDFFSNVVVLDSNIKSWPDGLKFKDATTGWLCGWGADTSDIFKFTGTLNSIVNAAGIHESFSIMPNPTSTEALVKLPASLNSKPLCIRIIDMNGKELEKRTIASSTGWTKLNASFYPAGIYLVELNSANRLIARAKWVINH
ncbi:MAG: T9SS type A sorting domain-containing protein [Bacteroidia bacterium]|nr:T9SS type A sorting domain-containing protein [Bacteroidia bacterium]